MANTIQAGAACVDITPTDSQFLYGYPHVKRYSTGVHDPLLSSALYLDDGQTKVVFITNDIIFVTRQVAQRVRSRIAESTGVPVTNIMITATHTHSGPITTRHLSSQVDSTVPQPDAEYMKRFEEGIVAAAKQACANACPAELALAVADGSCVGTNRRDPSGPSDPQVPVLVVRESGGGPFIGVMLVCCMHPTVLHEDSTLVSGDFPGMTRQYLRQNVLRPDCPVLHHTGTAGNQSPRHVTRANTFEEAERLGTLLGQSIERAMGNLRFTKQAKLSVRQKMLDDLPVRRFPSVAEAAAKLERAKTRLDQLRSSEAPRTETRTAECDWFGAEETLTLARAAESGRLQQNAATCLPAEVQVIRVGSWSFVGWPAEVFVEFGLDVKSRFPDTYVIALANGELEGYLVTAEAAQEGGYEASNAIFQSPDTGQRLVEATVELLNG